MVFQEVRPPGWHCSIGSLPAYKEALVPRHEASWLALLFSGDSEVREPGRGSKKQSLLAGIALLQTVGGELSLTGCSKKQSLLAGIALSVPLSRNGRMASFQDIKPPGRHCSEVTHYLRFQETKPPGRHCYDEGKSISSNSHPVPRYEASWQALLSPSPGSKKQSLLAGIASFKQSTE